MKIILLISLLLSCVHIVASQNKESSLSSISASGSTSTDVNAQLKLAAKEALAALESNPDDLDNVMKQLANVLLTEIGEIVTALLNGAQINAEIVSVDISDAVGNAISVAASSGEKFSGLEVDSITEEIRLNVEAILSNLGPDADVSRVTSDVANAVLIAIGNALADITGTNFTFKITVEASAQTDKENQKINQFNSTDDALIKLEKEFYQQFSDSLISIEENPQQLNTEFSLLAAELVDMFSQIFEYLIYAGETKAGHELSNRIIFSIQKLLDEVKSGENGFFQELSLNKIIRDIEIQLEITLQNFQINMNINEFSVEFVKAILEPIGRALSELVQIQFTLKIDSSPDSQSVINSVEITQETNNQSRDIQLQVSLDILQALPNTQKSFNLLTSAAQKGQNIAIAASFLQAISQGYQKELKKLLNLFFTDKSIPIDTIVFVTTLTTVQGGGNAINIFVQKIQEITDLQQQQQQQPQQPQPDLQQLSRAFSYAFTTFDRSITDAFLTLILRSIEDGKCGLKDLVGGMVDGIPKYGYKNVIALLEQLGAESCIEKFSSENLNLNQLLSPVVEDIDEVPVTEQRIDQNQGDSSLTSKDNLINELEQLVNDSVFWSGYEPFMEDLSFPSPQPSSPKISIETPTEDCADIIPPSNFTCQEQANFGKCSVGWMITGGFCKFTCGRCNEPNNQTQTPSIPSPIQQSSPLISSSNIPPVSTPTQIRSGDYTNSFETPTSTPTQESISAQTTYIDSSPSFTPSPDTTPTLAPTPVPPVASTPTPTPTPPRGMIASPTPTPSYFTPTQEYNHASVSTLMATPGHDQNSLVRVPFSNIEQQKASGRTQENNVISPVVEQTQCQSNCNKCAGFDEELLKQIIKTAVLEALSEALGESKK